MAELCRRAVEIAPQAFKGSDLDREQSRQRKEVLCALMEELATRVAQAPAAPKTPQEMAARLRKRAFEHFTLERMTREYADQLAPMK